MKTAVLTISRHFPAGHPRAGQPTEMMNKHLKGAKKHTIRDNIAYWEDIVAKVKARVMYISVRMWIGKPRQSPQQEMNRITTAGTQRIEMTYIDEVLSVLIDGKEWTDHETLATNDGLSLADFIGWFFPRRKRTHYEGVIIHFTNFRY
jgi:hypothetical protein